MPQNNFIESDPFVKNTTVKIIDNLRMVLGLGMCYPKVKTKLRRFLNLGELRETD